MVQGNDSRHAVKAEATIAAAVAVQGVWGGGTGGGGLERKHQQVLLVVTQREQRPNRCRRGGGAVSTLFARPPTPSAARDSCPLVVAPSNFFRAGGGEGKRKRGQNKQAAGLTVVPWGQHNPLHTTAWYRPGHGGEGGGQGGLPQHPSLGVSGGAGHVIHHHLGELRALQFLALAQREQALEVIGHGAVLNRLLHPVADHVGGLVPAQVPKHHLSREHQPSGVDFVQPGVLRCSAVVGLEQSSACLKVDVCARGDPNPTNLGRKGVGDVRPVEGHGDDHVELLGPRHDLLKGDVRNGVPNKELLLPLPVAMGVQNGFQNPGNLLLDVLLLHGSHHVIARLQCLAVIHHIGQPSLVIAQNPGLALRHTLAPELAGGNTVAPILEATLGELLDVPLVHQIDVGLPLLQGVLDSGAHHALRTRLRDRLEPVRRGHREPHLAVHLLLLKELVDFSAFRGPQGKLNACVNILRGVTEDGAVNVLGVLHRGRKALREVNGPNAAVEIKGLSQLGLHGAPSVVWRRHQGTLDPNNVLVECGNRLLWHCSVVLLHPLLSSENLHPADFPGALVRLLHRSVNHVPGGLPHVRT
eukprot:RCo007827